MSEMRTWAFEAGISTPVYVRAETRFDAVKRLEQTLGVALIMHDSECTSGHIENSERDFKIVEAEMLPLLHKKIFIFADKKGNYSLREAVVIASSEPEARERLCLNNPTLAFVYRDDVRFKLLRTQDIASGVVNISEYQE